MKTDQYFVLTIVIFISGVLFGGTFITGHLELSSEAFFPAFATLVAAFLGAWTAFLLQDQKEKQKEIDRQVSLGNNVIAALVDNVNILHIFQQGYIEPDRHDQDNWLRMLPLPYKLEPNIEIDISNLSFLWEKGDANLTSRVSKEKLDFKLTLALINNRSNYHTENVQPVFDAMGFNQGGSIDRKVVLENLGPMRSANMQGLSENMIKSVDNTIQSHKAVITDLHNEMRRIFPNKIILDIESIELQEGDPTQNQ